MWPEIHNVLGLQFSLYDVMRGAAIAASLVLTVLLNRDQGISPRKTLLIAAVCVPVSVVAARFMNAIEYSSTWANIGAEFLRNSGSSIYGALTASLLSVAALTRVMHISTLRFLDSGAPAMAIGEAVSRVGCFCAGCCYGRTWNGPWSVVFPAYSFATADQRNQGLLDSTSTHSLPVHPVQLYGVILMSLLAWVLVWRFRKPHNDGLIFFLFLIGYGAYRLVIIPFRVEALASMKLFSVVFIAVGMLGLVWSRRPKPLA